MKLAANTKIQDDLRTKIKEHFADFNRKSRPSRSRRYPADLCELIGQGASVGIRTPELQKLSGMSSTAVWRIKSKAISPIASPPAEIRIAPRRLQVVDLEVDIRKTRDPLIIRLRSGVTIELPNESSLTSDLLLTLASLEVSHVASR